MHILLVSDLHYRLRQFDWLLAAAGDLDALVIAGDLLDIRSPVGLDVQAIAVSTALRALAEETVLLAASGNHDLDARDASIRRRSYAAAHGRTGSAAPGCSTPGSRPARCRRTSWSTWTPERPPGPRRRSAPSSS
jgi:Icc-related predicted phosphoesterase